MLLLLEANNLFDLFGLKIQKLAVVIEKLYIQLHCWQILFPLCPFLKESVYVNVSPSSVASAQSLENHTGECECVANELFKMGCKCISCDGEFASKIAADCHCSHPTYIGTGYADPSNIQSLSLTQRQDVAVGILCQHSTAPLGA